MTQTRAPKNTAGAARAILVLSILGGAAAVALAAADWSGAERKAKAFADEEATLRALTPAETRKLVTAICEAEEADRASVAKDASSRAKDVVARDFDKLEDLKDEAQKSLAAVLADASLSAQHSKAAAYNADIDKRWPRIERMTKAIRGANHPVVKWMLDRGNEAHAARQHRCDASEFTMGSDRVDCIMASGSTCTVIELKPKNAKAIKKGRGQAQAYAKTLNGELKKSGSPIIKKLIGIKRDFDKCTTFETRVDCYTLCPKIDADGEYDEVSVDWDEDCR